MFGDIELIILPPSGIISIKEIWLIKYIYYLKFSENS